MTTQVLNIPAVRPFGTAWNRRIRKYRRSLARAQRRAMRQTRLAYRAWLRNQYFLSTATRDAIRGARANEDIFVGTVIAMSTLALAMASVGTQLMYLIFETIMAISDVTGLGMVPMAFIGLSIISVLALWVAGMAVSALMTSVMHGLTAKRNKSLLSTLRLGLAKATRLTSAWLTSLFIVFAPIATTLLVPLVLTYLGYMEFDYLMIVAPYYLIAGIVWFVPALLQTALIPAVAVFEPSRSMLEVVERSEELVARRGRMLSLCLYGALVASVGVLWVIAQIMLWAFGTSETLTMAAGSGVLLAAFDILLVSLYRKRILARTR